MLRKAINVRPEKWGNLKPARKHSSRNNPEYGFRSKNKRAESVVISREYRILPRFWGEFALALADLAGA